MNRKLYEFKEFRVMPTRVGTIYEVDGHPIVQMEYCTPEEASSWAVEGVYHEWAVGSAEDPEVEQLCECGEQFDAHMFVEFLNRAKQYDEDDVYRELFVKKK